MLTALHIKLIDLDRKKNEVKKFFDEYKATLEALVKQNGVGHTFQDPEGIVYQIVEPDGKWVSFDKYSIDRTKRPGEERGSLSVKKAEELGFKVSK
jgi:hypothetical protein